MRAVGDFPILPTGKIDYCELNRLVRQEDETWQRAEVLFPADSLQPLLDRGASVTLHRSAGAA